MNEQYEKMKELQTLCIIDLAYNKRSLFEVSYGGVIF